MKKTIKLNELAHIKELKLILLLSLFTLLTSCASQKVSLAKKQPTLVFSVEAEFDDVKDDLIMAIENQGAVISYTAHSSSMFNRTAITLQIKETVYQKAEILLFCKAEISHKMVRSNPHSLALCPYPIAIYTLTKSPGIVFLTIRTPPLDFPEYNQVHQLLLKIIHETIDF